MKPFAGRRRQDSTVMLSHAASILREEGPQVAAGRSESAFSIARPGDKPHWSDQPVMRHVGCYIYFRGVLAANRCSWVV
jgi:hypothetical protein